MSDSLRDVPEFFENELGESLTVRTETLAAFRELGPPDLCHVTKINHTVKAGAREVGSYHHILGVDASSSASLAAYINSLTYSLDGQPGWFSKSTAWRINSGIFCCYNAFSHVDVRVEVKIPGGVDGYIVTARGERIEPTAQMWQECHVSAMLRAILYGEDDGYRLQALRRVYPITSLAMESKFLESCEALFWSGWKLGSGSEIQMTTLVRNHLADGLMRYFGACGRYNVAAQFFEKLYPRDSEVGALLAESYFQANQEVKGVRILYDSLKQNPASYPLLHAQADFLKGKQKYDAAIQLSRFAVKAAPSEFAAWAKLTEMYIEADNFELALLTLNSCPMFTFTDKDYPRMPQPARIHLPVNTDLNNVMDLTDYDPRTMDPSESYLLRLPAPGLRGTFAKAYAFLAQLVKKVGWDELLRLRSSVFVMEDEYRQQKAREEGHSLHSSQPESSGTATAAPVPPPKDSPPQAAVGSHSSPSTSADAMAEAFQPGKATTESPANPVQSPLATDQTMAGMERLSLNEQPAADPFKAASPKPTSDYLEQRQPDDDDIFEEVLDWNHDSSSKPPLTDAGLATARTQEPRATSPTQSKASVDDESLITVDTDNKGSHPQLTEMPNRLANDTLSVPRESPSSAAGKAPAIDDQPLPSDVAAENHENPSPAGADLTGPTHGNTEAKGPEQATDAGNSTTELGDTFPEKQPPLAAAMTHTDMIGSIHHKRLCERWLDNLFMVLYEDLRAYIDSMSEIYRSQTTPQSTFRHTAAEWEALGDLAWRLLYKPEAKEAYIHSVQLRFSPKSWLQLLIIYTEEGNLQMALNAVVQLSIYQEKWYNHMVYPSAIAANVVRLIREHGLSKVQNVLISMNLAGPLSKLVTRYFAFAQAFKLEGTEW
ncbi:bud site selection protein [Dimargaris verticillata]|uniref:Bud site selection protein n=1 Tax=Dimargaris verticillata TaxID=2761393 RepID=A0A9W8EER5_9FUNG|nr:bud site selection protein [Dimargaris verticillata]